MIKVCGLFDLVEPPENERVGWWAEYAYRSIGYSSRHITASWAVMEKLKGQDFRSVNEPFAGMGAQAKIVQHLWPNAVHTISDSNHFAVDHLRRNGFNARILDAYHDLIPADLQVADFGDLTMLRMTERPWNALLYRLFGQSSFVAMTDIAGNHVNTNRARYARISGDLIASHEDYLYALGRFVTRTWGYYPLYTSYRNWSSVTLYSPVDLCPHEVERTPDTPVGLEFVR